MLKRLASVCVRSAGHAQKRFRGKSKSKPKPRQKLSHPPKPPPNAYGDVGQPFSPSPSSSPSPFLPPTLVQSRSAPPDHLTPDTAYKYFEAHVTQWSQDPRTIARYDNFGFATGDMTTALAAFAETACSGFFSTPENQLKYQLSRFATKPANVIPRWAPLARQFEAEITFSNIFFSWCRHASDSAVLDRLAAKQKIDSHFLETVRHVAGLAFRRPAEEFPFTRRMQRKVIMHVGPTNSGKTHHALRALAAAKTGVYAGPLRLLAHEIWERLNLGQIVPLGVEEPPLNINGHPTSPSPSPSLSPSPSPAQSAALYSQDPQPISPYARPTNMLTGEEKKIVDPSSGLLACTVEMLSFRVEYDVGVIDEIQMIGDPERGFAWTSAVLGLSAKELHLCGEASAVPIIQALLAETGDELEVRMYERLSPLHVEDKSLDNDYSKIQKGDCVVTFSRHRIFEIKTEIEKKSGLKCAVVYGKLPPEIRSEQAALFNDPNSGFDVIIGSDAIGMGLNLKIRRIVFDTVSKRDGSSPVRIPLSISQTKQIAGRAGRYGHSIDTSSPPGGYVTTLLEKDLPFIKDALAHPTTPVLQHAYVGPTVESMEALCSALPILRESRASSLYDPPSSSEHTPNTSLLESVQMAHLYVSSFPLSYKYINTGSPGSLTKLARTCTWIERHAEGALTWSEKVMWMVSPVAWRDDLCMKCSEVIIKRQREDMDVGDIKAVLEETGTLLQAEASANPDPNREKRGFMEVLEWTEEQMKAYHMAQEALAKLRNEEGSGGVEMSTDGARKGGSPSFSPSPSAATIKQTQFTPEITDDTLGFLESFHKILVFYMWMLFRNSVVFSDQVTTEELKKRVEVALDWALQVISFSRKNTNDKNKKGKGKGRGKLEREEVFSERASIKQLMEDYQKRNPKERFVWDGKNKGGEEAGKKIGEIETLDSAELRARAKRAWVQAPDLTTLLKNYVEDPSLKVGRRSEVTMVATGGSARANVKARSRP